MAAQRGPVLIVDDEHDERHALRAMVELWEHRVAEAQSGARGIELAVDRGPKRGMRSLLRAGLGMLAAPLIVAGYAGLTGLILPLVVVRSVFRRPSTMSATKRFNRTFLSSSWRARRPS